MCGAFERITNLPRLSRNSGTRCPLEEADAEEVDTAEIFKNINRLTLKRCESGIRSESGLCDTDILRASTRVSA